MDELVERSGTLKGELLEFTRRPQFNRALKQELVGRFGDPVVAEEHEIENFFDWFVLEYRRPDGRTVVDCFLEARPDLPAEEREMLFGWRDVVEGVFEVTGREGPELVTVSLIDDLEYRMLSNIGPAIFDRFEVGGFIITRLVPLAERWLIVDALGPAESAGLIFDETDGLGVFADYRLVEEAFTDPELAGSQPYRKLLKAYLTDDTVSSVALMRLAERDHDKTDRVFRKITGKPSLRWAEHGEALLRSHKPTWFGARPLPRTVVISDRLAPYLSRTG